MMDKSAMPFGIRANNPGNLKFTRDRWQGLDDPPFVVNKGSGKKFFRFKSPAYGIRAVARTLITYQDKRLADDGSAIDTVREIVTRWAPPEFNDTESYITDVLKRAKINRGAHVDLDDFDTMEAIVKAIIHHENGCQPYSRAILRKGLVLAGVEVEEAVVMKKSATMKATKVAGAATGLTMAAEYAQQAQVVLPVIERVMHLAPWILGAVVFAALGWVAWTRWSEAHEEGI